MKTVQQIKENLIDLRKCVINLSVSYLTLPDSLVQIDYQELLDEIKYLRGYVDCMIEFKLDTIVRVL